MESNSCKNHLLLTPSWPPAYCGVADFSQKLYQEISKKYDSEFFVYGEKHCNKRKCDLKVIKEKVLEKPFDIIHIILHTHHLFNASKFYDIVQFIKENNKRAKIILSAIEIGRNISKQTKKILNHSDGVIVYDKNTYRKLKPLSKKIIEMPCGATVEPKINFKRKIKQKHSGDSFEIIFWGFINRNKGIETLLEAMKFVPRDLPIKLTIKGAFHENIGKKKNETIMYRNRLSEYIKKSKDNRIILQCDFYQIDDLSSFLLKSDCCILPFNDGASNKRSSLFNTLAFGLPIITTKTDITPTIFKNSPFIKLVEVNNSSQLAEQIILAYKENLKVAIKKRDVMSYFNRSYSWEMLSRKIFDFYQEIA